MLDHKRIAAADIQTDCVFFSLGSAPRDSLDILQGREHKKILFHNLPFCFLKKSLLDEAASIENTSDEGRTELKLECTQARGYRNSDMFAHDVNI